MYPKRVIETARLRTSYYRAGEGRVRKLLLLHGNLSSAAFYLPLFQKLSRTWDVVAPDLRCFGDTEDAPLDATRGYRDWSDDVYAFCQALGWDRFYLAGWSMGGDVVMQFTIDHPEMVERLILIAPGSPYGFGGSYGEDGTTYYPLGLGSGGGCANPGLVNVMTKRSRLFMRDMLHHFFFKPPFRLSWQWENLMIEESCKVKIGDDRYPGSFRVCARWPYVMAGKTGVLNAMSPKYGNLNALLDVKEKPMILWVRGDSDEIVSDHSMMEFGYLGQLGLVQGWPGEQVYPPQPMVKQMRHFLNEYASKGGSYNETVIDGGHMCILEHPDEFLTALREFAS